MCAWLDGLEFKLVEYPSVEPNNDDELPYKQLNPISFTINQYDYGLTSKRYQMLEVWPHPRQHSKKRRKEKGWSRNKEREIKNKKMECWARAYENWKRSGWRRREGEVF